jgi:hypothetical protein
MVLTINKKLINNVRELIFNKDARELGGTYKKLYKGVKINHKTLEYKNERGRISYVSVPESAIKYALNRGQFGKFEAIKTTEPVKMWNRNFQKLLYKGGDYTTDEIRKHTQEFSNKFLNEGKQGVISVAVRNYGEGRGVWRSGKLRPFGERVEFLQADSDGLPIPERHTGFAIFYVSQN